MNEAVGLDPNSAEAFSARGAAWLGKGDLEQAIADCSRTIAIDPEAAPAYSNRGEAWAAKGRNEKAKADFRKAELLLKRPLFSARR